MSIDSTSLIDKLSTSDSRVEARLPADREVGSRLIRSASAETALVTPAPAEKEAIGKRQPTMPAEPALKTPAITLADAVPVPAIREFQALQNTPQVVALLDYIIDDLLPTLSFLNEDENEALGTLVEDILQEELTMQQYLFERTGQNETASHHAIQYMSDELTP